VIHAAGVSPRLRAAEYVMGTNALGTLNANEAFTQAAGEGSAIVNVASMAAHMPPERLIPAQQFPLALTDEDRFMDEMLSACDIAPEDARSGIAYAVSESFLRWYSTSQAERFNGQGLRIVSVSPGSVDTEMGRLEEKAGAGAMVADAAVALGQAGRDGRAACVLRKRQSGLPDGHRHPERWWSDRLDDATSAGGRPKALKYKTIRAEVVTGGQRRKACRPPSGTT